MAAEIKHYSDRQPESKAVGKATPDLGAPTVESSQYVIDVGLNLVWPDGEHIGSFERVMGID